MDYYSATSNTHSQVDQTTQSLLRSRASEYGWPKALWSLIAGAPKPQEIKPRGHSAWVENALEVVVPFATLAFSIAAAYALAEPELIILSDDIAAGKSISAMVLPVMLLSVIVVTGVLIDFALLTAGSRLRMHAVRGEWAWMIIQALMLLLCIGVETTTAAYLFYKIDPNAVPDSVKQVMSQIHEILFWVRAFMGPVCLVYVRAGVLPLSTERSDVNRLVAAKSGSYIVLLLDEIMKLSSAGEERFLSLIDRLDAYMNTFRAATSNGDRYEAEDTKLIAALRQLHTQEASGAQVAAALASHRQDYAEREAAAMQAETARAATNMASRGPEAARGNGHRRADELAVPRLGYSPNLAGGMPTAHVQQRARADVGGMHGAAYGFNNGQLALVPDVVDDNLDYDAQTDPRMNTRSAPGTLYHLMPRASQGGGSEPDVQPTGPWMPGQPTTPLQPNDEPAVQPRRSGTLRPLPETGPDSDPDAPAATPRFEDGVAAGITQGSKRSRKSASRTTGERSSSRKSGTRRRSLSDMSEIAEVD